MLQWPRLFPKNIPQQENGCDCGVFAILFAEYAVSVVSCVRRRDTALLTRHCSVPCSYRVPETPPISMRVACHVQSRDAPMKFTQEDIQYFRVKILNEILELRVE